MGAMLMTAVVILAQSRSAYVGAAAGLLLAAILTWEQGRRLLLVAAPVGLAGLWLWGPNRALDFVLAMDATAVGGGGTWESRSEVWLRAIYMMQDFPFTGIGLNTFPLVLDALYPAFLSGPDARIPHAHNLFLQTGVDLGLPGLMALLWMLGIVARCLRLAWGRDQVAMRPVVEGETQELVASSDANEAAAVRIIVAGVAAGLVAHGIYSMTDTVTLGAKPGVMLWWVLALAVIASRVARTGDGPTSPGPREPAETPA